MMLVVIALLELKEKLLCIAEAYKTREFGY